VAVDVVEHLEVVEVALEQLVRLVLAAHLQRLGELLLFDRIALCEPLPGGDGGDQDPEDQRHDRQAEVRGRRAVGIRVAREGGRDNLRRLGDRRLAAGFEAPAPGGRRAT
jgi:hypothetical protein